MSSSKTRARSGAEPDSASIVLSSPRRRASTRESTAPRPPFPWSTKVIAKHRHGWLFIAGFAQSPIRRMDSVCTSQPASISSPPTTIGLIFPAPASPPPPISSSARMDIAAWSEERCRRRDRLLRMGASSFGVDWSRNPGSRSRCLPRRRWAAEGRRIRRRRGSSSIGCRGRMARQRR